MIGLQRKAMLHASYITVTIFIFMLITIFLNYYFYFLVNYILLSYLCTYQGIISVILRGTHLTHFITVFKRSRDESVEIEIFCYDCTVIYIHYIYNRDKIN